MPPAIPSKPTETIRKNLSENRELKKLQLMAKEIGKVGRGPEGCEPAPKPIKKTTVTAKVKKPASEGDKKKILSAVPDKLPKKTAQRAKGSIALEKVDQQTLTKKKQANSVDQIPKPGTRENSSVDVPRPPIPLKQKASDKPVRARSTRKLKTVKIDSKEGVRKTPDKKQKQPWTPVVAEEQEKPLSDEEVAAKEVPQESSTVVPDSASTTCSFFEKIQQGVRAYFSVRGNLKSDFSVEDKNKKVSEEGIDLGSQTKPGVVKEAKEDIKKKSTKCLKFDRLKSSQPNNLPKTFKPKISRHFRKLKLIYHPKKHYVRIQIPRQGYFYRSTTVQHKESPPHSIQPPPQPRLQRLASNVESKRKPKVQVSGVASSSVKGSDILEKRVKSEEESNLFYFPENPVWTSKMLLPVGYLTTQSHVLNATSCSEVNCGRNDVQSKSGSFEQFLRNVPFNLENLLPQDLEKFTNSQLVPNEQDAISNCKVLVDEYNIRGNKLVNLECDNKKLSAEDELQGRNILIRKKTYFGQHYISSSENDVCDSTIFMILDQEGSWSHVNITSYLETSTEELQPETNFKPFIEYLNFALGREDLSQLDINTVQTPAEIQEIPLIQIQGLKMLPPNMDPISAKCKEFDDTKAVRYPTIPNVAGILSRDNSDDYKIQLESDNSKDSVAAPLMEDIDLHLELQSYLKTIETSDNVTKKRTKNTLQPYRWSQFQNYEDIVGTIVMTADTKVHLNQPEENQKDTESKKSNVSFVSAVSKNDGDSGHFIENLEVVRESRTAENGEDTCPKPKVGGKTVLKKVSMQFSQMKEADTLINSFFLLSRLHLLKRIYIDRSEEYEKINPLKTPSITSLKEKIRSKRKGLLLTQKIYRRLATYFPNSIMRTFPSGLSLSYQSSSEDSDSYTSTTSTNTFYSDHRLGSDFSNIDSRKKWSPNLQDLINIYNTVLKENHKASQIGRNTTQRCIAAPLYAFMNEKLFDQNKRVTFNRNTSAVCYGKSKDGKKNEPPKLEEYVSMFQEILMSSLSIKQIARLNSMLANLQTISAKNYELVKNLTKKKEMENEKKDAVLPARKPQMRKLISFREKKIIPKKKESSSNDTKVVKPILYPQKRVKKKENVKVEKIKQATKLSGMPQKPSNQISKKTTKKQDNQTKKLMVTVKLSKDKIVVSEMRQLENDKSLKALKRVLSSCSNTSDLIIENVTKPLSNPPAKPILKKKKKTQIRASHPEGASKLIKPSNPVPKSNNKPETKSQIKISESGSSKKSTISSNFKRNNFQNITVPQRKVKSERSSKHAKYAYNQEQLKIQHPIEAIVESSEPKLDERVEKVPHKSQELRNEAQETATKNISYDVNALKEALEGILRENRVFLKDLVWDFNPAMWSEGEIKNLDRIKSQVLPKSQINETSACVVPNKNKKDSEFGKSLDDATLIKPTQNTSRKKLRKCANTQNTYLCYPSLQPLSENSSAPSNEVQTEAKNNENKKQPKFYKKLVSCVGACTQSKECDLYKELKNPRQDTTEKASELHSKPSTNTILFLNTEITPECCSVEFLYNDKTGNQSLNVSPKMSNNELQDKKALQANDVQMKTPLPVEPKKSHQNHTNAMKSHRESPIVIHPAKSQDDDTSFQSLMIQSDSYLKCCSSMAISKNKVEAVLKSNSDVKFYPGRLTESAAEENPLVTFVLTPKQEAQADLPKKQVKVVGRSSTKRRETKDDVETQIPLEHIVKFIEILSKTYKQEPPLKKTKPISRSGEKKPVSRIVQRKRKFIPRQRTQAKGHQECQIKKKEEKPNNVKTKIKKVKNTTGQLVVVSNVAESGLTKNDKLNSGNGPEDKMAGENFKIEGDAVLCSSLVKLLNESKQNPEVLQTVNNKTTPAPIFKGKQKTIDAIEVYSKRLSSRKKSSQTFRKGKIVPIKLETLQEEIENPPKENRPEKKKTRTFKIKIYCNNQNQKSGFKQSNEKRSKAVKTQEASSTKVAMELLESLVSRQGEDGDHLHRTPSTYFDAESETTGLEVLKAEEELFQKPPLCFEFNVSTEKTDTGDSTKVEQAAESKSDGHTSVALTPSDVFLLSKPCLSDDSKEKIFNKIIKNLQSNNVYYSILLLEGLLNKMEAFENSSATLSPKLQEVIKSVESKSRNLMIRMEKNSWLKILSFLEEISDAFETGMESKINFSNSSKRIFSSSDLQLKVAASLDYLKKQIKETKKFVEKIKTLNEKRFVDLQRVSEYPSQICSNLDLQAPDSCDLQGLTKSEADSKNVFHKIRDSISELKNKLLSNWSQILNGRSFDELEEGYTDEEDFPRAEHVTKNTSDIFNHGHSSNGKFCDSLRSLKKKIRQQRFCVQYLLNNSYEPVPCEVQKLKKKVAEKMKFLERTVTWLDKAHEGLSSDEELENKWNEDKLFIQ